jgi:hypothetical protein
LVNIKYMSKQKQGLKEKLESGQNTTDWAFQRLGERYDWGHITKVQYLAEHNELQKQLSQLAPAEEKFKNLDRLAHFLDHVSDVWKVGTQEQLNKMANVLFEQIWIEDSRVIEVKPREELKPFFQLSFEEHLEKSIWRPRGVSDCDAISRFWVLSSKYAS